MVKKKVTLSIESKIYDDFQDYCEKNAIMLSKKVELVMKDLVKHKKEFVFVFFFLFFMSISAYALTFTDINSGNFNNGTYVNTTHNGTGVVLSGTNLSGTFTSRIFDAGNSARLTWLNFSGNTTTRDYLYAVDASAAVYYSSDSGGNWTLKNASYTAGTPGDTQGIFSDSNGSLYILKSSARQVWKSSDVGKTWSVVNSTFSSGDLYEGVSGSGNLYVFVANGAGYKSSDHGSTWTALTDFNGVANNPPAGSAVNSSGAIFTVDTAGKVYYSIDSGSNWVNSNAGYGRTSDTQEMFADQWNNLYILSNTNKEVWRSNGTGSVWSVVNNSFAGAQPIVSGGKDIYGNIYAVTSTSVGKVFVSGNNGTSWAVANVSYNQGTGASRGITDLVLNSSLIFQVRNCTTSCVAESFVGSDGSASTYFTNMTSSVNLTGRYFQYRAYLSSQNNFSSILNNASLTYGLLDVTPPSIVIYSPSNTTYNSSSVFLNYSASDESGISACNYTIDSIAISLPTCSTATISGLAEGSHSLVLYANDTLGNTNSSSVVFSVDSRPPSWSNPVASVPTVYTPNVSFFNVSYSDSGAVDLVWLESNFSGQSLNYTMHLISGTTYGYNVSIPAGTFFWKTYANDTLGNVNSTNSQTFTIAKAGNAIYLYLNGNLSNTTILYAVQSNATAVSSSGSVDLYRDSVLVSNPDIGLLGAKVSGYQYFANASGNENYSSNSSLRYLFVLKQSPVLALTLNNLSSSLTFDYGNQSVVNGSESNVGDEDVSYRLYRSNVSVGSGSEVVDINLFGAGTYIYVYNSTGGENYSAGTVSRVLIVNRSVPVLSLFINGVQANGSQTYGSQSNASSFLSNALAYTLYKNNTLFASGSDWLSDVAGLSAGQYNYTAVFSGNENYSFVVKSYVLDITKATPAIQLLLNGQSSDLSLPLGSLLSVDASLVSPSGVIYLYENGSLVSSGQNVSAQRNYTSLGNRVWTASFLEEANYSARNVSLTASVLDSSAPQYSNIVVSPTTPASYSPGAQYTFNITWTDNSAIQEVILNFNGTNYTYSSGQILKNGNEYYYSVSNLAARNYSYKWYANDTTNNVTSTGSQLYIVAKATPSVILSFSPGNSVSYGVATSVSCVLSTSQSTATLTRDLQSVSNPDNSNLGVGGYIYSCSASESQNYSISSSIGVLTVSKATPALQLLLNGASIDLTLPAEGAEVNISSSISSPNDGVLNLTVDNSVINYGVGSAENLTFFSVTGSHTVSSSYSGNENYSASTVSRNVFVSAPSASTPSSSSSGGGSAGFVVSGATGAAKVQFNSLEKKLKLGASDKINFEVANTGLRFLNRCTIKFSGDKGSWFKNSERKSMASGESVTYEVAVSVPSDASFGTYAIPFELSCNELQTSGEMQFEVVKTNFGLEYLRQARVDVDKLTIYYRLREFVGKDKTITVHYRLLNGQGVEILNEKIDVSVSAGETKDNSITMNLPKGAVGEFKVELSAESEGDSLSTSVPVLLSSRGLTGFAISSDNQKALYYVVGILGGLLVIYFVYRFFLGRRARLHKAIYGRHVIHKPR